MKTAETILTRWQRQKKSKLLITNQNYYDIQDINYDDRVPFFTYINYNPKLFDNINIDEVDIYFIIDYFSYYYVHYLSFYHEFRAKLNLILPIIRKLKQLNEKIDVDNDLINLNNEQSGTTYENSNNSKGSSNSENSSATKDYPYSNDDIDLNAMHFDSARNVNKSLNKNNNTYSNDNLGSSNTTNRTKLNAENFDIIKEILKKETYQQYMIRELTPCFCTIIDI